jgi:glutamate dehydrogenase/leucine dehydrogenase
MDVYSKLAGMESAPGVITGKPLSLGGSLARNVATGLGCAYCVREAAKTIGLKLRGAKVVIQGFGNAGTFAAEYLEKMGAKVIAVSDTKGSIINPKGLDSKKVLAFKEKTGSVVGYPGSKKISTEQLLTTKCDVLVPAALENQINASIAKKLQCKIIAEAANGPTMPEADPIIYQKRIIVIPDILANSGGVCISYLEWVQNNMGYYWTFDEVASKMESHIVRGFKDTLALSKKHKIDMRRAAMVLAVGRVVEAFKAKGLWP